MQSDEFILKASERTGFERDQAEAVTRATLATLAARSPAAKLMTWPRSSRRS